MRTVKKRIVAQGCPSRIRQARRGMAAVIAMLFLVLFGTLAVGFLVTTQMASQVAGNEQKLGLARMSADSGMEFIRYQLGSITLPSGSNASNILANTAAQLATLPALSSSANMGNNTVTVSNGAIYIPSQTSWMTLDSNLHTRFQAAITQINGTSTLLVTTHGGAGSSRVTGQPHIPYTVPAW